MLEVRVDSRYIFGDGLNDMKERGDSRMTPVCLPDKVCLRLTVHTANSSFFISQPALNIMELKPTDTLRLSPATAYPFYQDWWDFQHKSKTQTEELCQVGQ